MEHIVEWILKYMTGPLVGAIIGYCTNYIAVKMLFFPKKEIRFLGRRLPFTPGAIPRGKERLAKAVGQVVGNTLITQDDIARNLLSENNAKGIADSLKNKLSDPVKNEVMTLTDLTEQEYILCKTPPLLHSLTPPLPHFPTPPLRRYLVPARGGLPPHLGTWWHSSPSGSRLPASF